MNLLIALVSAVMLLAQEPERLPVAMMSFAMFSMVSLLRKRVRAW